MRTTSTNSTVTYNSGPQHWASRYGQSVGHFKVTVTDAEEPPGRPRNPRAAIEARAMRWASAWDVPNNTGPGVTGYEARLRVSDENGVESWMDASLTLAGPSGRAVWTPRR